MPILQLTSLRIDRRSRECHPSRVQLLWSLASAQPGLLLLQKRSAHEICLLPVEMPIPLAVYGPQLFRCHLAKDCQHPSNFPVIPCARHFPDSPNVPNLKIRNPAAFHLNFYLPTRNLPLPTHSMPISSTSWRHPIQPLGIGPSISCSFLHGVMCMALKNSRQIASN